MNVYLYNSLSGKKECFYPINANELKIYVCGMTVYDNCHIGHARTQIAFDTIVRYFRYIGFRVTYVRNITDIDDKIIQSAHDNNESIDILVERIIKNMHIDLDALNIQRPDFEPRVTHHIPEICRMISVLIDKGFAYLANNGDVYYRVKKFKKYGKLSKQSLLNLLTGVRIDTNKAKENPLDFVLWKASKSYEPSWSSPWGKGRPGWHIECSVMSKQFLGSNFDIHAGGSDLKFPHHENEIAQSEAANSCKFANYWLHTGMVKIDNEKMSKSLDNFFSIKEVLSKYHPEVIRFFLISGHYRSSLHYSKKNLDHAKLGLERLYVALRNINLKQNISATKEDDENLLNNFYARQFKKAMNNDFNTPEAISVLFAITKEINKYKYSNTLKAINYAKLLLKLSSILGILQYSPEKYLKYSITNQLSDEEIEINITERILARKNKNFDKADKIREKLASSNVILEDTSKGTIWKRN